MKAPLRTMVKNQEVIPVLPVADEHYYERHQKNRWLAPCGSWSGAAAAAAAAAAARWSWCAFWDDTLVLSQMTMLRPRWFLELTAKMVMVVWSGGSGRRNDIVADVDQLPLPSPPTTPSGWLWTIESHWSAIKPRPPPFARRAAAGLYGFLRSIVSWILMTMVHKTSGRDFF